MKKLKILGGGSINSRNSNKSDKLDGEDFEANRKSQITNLNSNFKDQTNEIGGFKLFNIKSVNVKKLNLKSGKINLKKFRTRSEENTHGERGQSSASD